MKFSEYWLREMVNVDLDRTALLNQITMAGLEVTDVKPVAKFFHGVLIGKIITCRQHSTVNTLCVAKIDIGKDYILNIVSNDLKCRQGMKVAVATLGAELPNSFKIKPTYLHGEVSEGILCSFAELGISNDYYKGIIKLPVDAPVGTDIRHYLQLDDYTFEVSVTSNRADCLSIVGIARDLAALNKVTLNTPIIKLVKSTITDIISICVNVTTACPRYLGRIVKGVNVKAETPVWMIEKLRRCGVSSINPIIDITNYVLLELGQPMNAFDLDHINGDIIVRMANDGEVVTLLNNNKVKLNSNTLVVSDNNKILAIGGILSSQHATVDKHTQNIFFECAFFNPSAIIGRAHSYGLRTNSSYRYERGVDQELQHKAIERATYLLIKICGGKAGPIIDKTDKNTLPQCGKLILHRKKLNRLLGHIITNEIVSDILMYIGCKVTIGIGEWRVIVPSWRFDLTIEEDLIEEIARIYGYNNIPNIPIKASLIMTKHRETNLSLKRVKNLLVDKGYQEVITYSFVDPVIQQLVHPNEEALILPNPISINMSVMRLSLWTGLLSTVIHNYKRQQESVRLFEAGLCFIPDKKAELGVHQNFMLSGILSGNRYEEHWDLKYQSVDFYDLKGDLESLLDLTGKLERISFRTENHPAMHPGKSARIYLYEECIGFIGAMHPKLELKLNLNKHTIMFELIWSKISNRILPKANHVSRFPENRRDIAMIVNENVPAADIIAECKKVGQNQVVSVKLFDVYRGKGINKGKKSLAISLIVQDTNRTLEEEEIAATINKCVAALKERFQATLRD